MSIRLPLEHSYAALPERFFAHVRPTPVPSPRLVGLNEALARQLGLDPAILSSAEGAAVLAGNRIAEGTLPIAMAYAGHQFGSFVPQLGDGRAILLGEAVDADGVRRDVQLKGAGRTPFSRMGDGRAVLGPVLREYLVSEAMSAMKIPTTRALAAVTTGERIVRDGIQPGAVLTRVAASHIRVGTFQFFAVRDDLEGVRVLADYVIGRHYPQAADAAQPYAALLAGVIEAQASLVAQWLLVGFIHGVMNTDNMAVSGETIDYGPCAFMDEYDPATVYSAIDRWGRYAYGNQPAIAEWNLARFAETLLPLLAEDADVAVEQAQAALGAFMPALNAAYRAGLRRKLGLQTSQDDDALLADDLLRLMAASRADFTLTFRRLADAAADPAAACPARSLFADPAGFDEWLGRWHARLEREPMEGQARAEAMRRVNPAFIPRNHRVEAMIRAAVDRDDFAPFEELLTVLSRPFDDQPEFAHYMEPPQHHERVHQTFCGT